jgi:hypothetical protein
MILIILHDFKRENIWRKQEEVERERGNGNE